MDNDNKQRSAVYQQLHRDLQTVSLKPGREITSQDADDILDSQERQQKSPKTEANSSPRIADIMSWTLDPVSNSFHHRRWDCYNVHCEAAARILRQSDENECTGFHPRLVLFVLNLDSQANPEGGDSRLRASAATVRSRHAIEKEQEDLVMTKSVRLEAKNHILSTFGVDRIQFKDAVTFAKHPGRLKTYQVSAASFIIVWNYDPAVGSTVAMLSYTDLQGSRIARALVQGLIDHEWLCGFPMLLALWRRGISPERWRNGSIFM